MYLITYILPVDIYDIITKSKTEERLFRGVALCVSNMALESPLSSPKKYEPMQDGVSFYADPVPQPPPATPPLDHVVSVVLPVADKSPVLQPDLPTPVNGPAPRNVSSDELHILQTCLTRWRTEVEQDVKGE